ncbi:Wzz/FepE/Etk N-terminal domain-containing protein [Candidatus Neomicrothrix sp.]|nr:Wzz/FepE/Etk N-terminal domain-containing protein [Candidatus Microthrix sp.]MBP7985953.1 hypothetical protein [Candidatus Microthrix sp.]
MWGLVRAYWRIPVIALLGGLIAFGGSFIAAEKYSSTTRVLIRGREATFLTTSGTDLSQAPGVIDASLAKSLAETQSGVVTSREVATIVVDELDLDQPKKSDGFLSSMVSGLGRGYKCAKSLVSHGFCKEPKPREGAIQAVQAGVSANQLGSTDGEASGQPAGFVMEVVGTGENPEEARAVANATADALVAVSEKRFTSESARNVDNLAEQAKKAAAESTAANQAVTEFRLENNMSSAERQEVAELTAVSESETNTEDVAVKLAGARSELAQLEQSVQSASQRQSSSQVIETGRSQNRIDDDSPNPVYNDLVAAREQLKGRIADLEAQSAALADLPNGATDAELSRDQTELLTLQTAADLSADNQAEVEKEYRAALLGGTRASSELTRIGTASLPTYPDEPKRILYLALGLLFGALAGAYLTWRRLPTPVLDELGEVVDPPAVDESDGDQPSETAEVVVNGAAAAPNGKRHKVDALSGGGNGKRHKVDASTRGGNG